MIAVQEFVVQAAHDCRSRSDGLSGTPFRLAGRLAQVPKGASWNLRVVYLPYKAVTLAGVVLECHGERPIAFCDLDLLHVVISVAIVGIEATQHKYVITGRAIECPRAGSDANLPTQRGR